MEHTCVIDGVMPKEFLQAVKNGAVAQVKTDIGWITVSQPDYRNSVQYRIKPA